MINEVRLILIMHAKDVGSFFICVDIRHDINHDIYYTAVSNRKWVLREQRVNLPNNHERNQQGNRRVPWPRLSAVFVLLFGLWFVY